MEDKKTQEILFQEGVQEKMTSMGVTLLESGELLFRGARVSPRNIQDDIDLTTVERVEIGNKEGDDTTLVVSYLIWPVTYTFECTVMKDEKGENTIYFYRREENEKSI